MNMFMMLQTSFEFAFPVKAGVGFMHTPEHWRLAFRDLDLRLVHSHKPTVINGYSTVRFAFDSVLGSGSASLFSNNETSVRLVIKPMFESHSLTCISMKVKPSSKDHHVMTIDCQTSCEGNILAQVISTMSMQRHTIKHALRRRRDNVLLEDENFRLYRKQVFNSN